MRLSRVLLPALFAIASLSACASTQANDNELRTVEPKAKKNPNVTFGFFFALGSTVRSSLSFACVLAHADRDAMANSAGSSTRESLMVAPLVERQRAS